MGKTIIFFAAFLCLSLPAAAQEIATAFETSNPAGEPAAIEAVAPGAAPTPALEVAAGAAPMATPEAVSTDAAPAEPAPVPVHFEPSDREEWQLGLGFQYEHFGVFGVTFNNPGFNASITRYFNDWFGIEGATNMGWGHTSTSPSIPRALDAKSFFVGGGPHIAMSNKSRFEPWGHVVVGLAHFRFTQTNNQLGLGSNSALGFLAGGGVDYKLGGRAYWRIQADYVETHFLSEAESNYSFGTGIVFNF